MGTVLFFVLLVIVGIGAEIIRRHAMKKLKEADMVKHKRNDYLSLAQGCIITSIFSVVIVVLSYVSCGIYSVDEGEGVVLTQFGKIYDQVTEPGLDFKRPWADRITWRTRLASLDEKIDARSKDEMKVIVDATIWWKVKSDSLDTLYSQVAKNYDTLQDGFVIPGIRSAVRDEVAKV